MLALLALSLLAADDGLMCTGVPSNLSLTSARATTGNLGFVDAGTVWTNELHSTTLQVDSSATMPALTVGYVDGGVVHAGTLDLGSAGTLTNVAGLATFSAAIKTTGNTTANAFVSQGGGTTCFACAATSIITAGTLVRGSIVLSTGTGTATVSAGAFCVCTDTTANASVRCAVASTTLTATGTGSDVIAYVCLN